MIRVLRLSLLILLLMFASCQKIGGEGEKCLDGNTCKKNNLVCTQQGICEVCGGKNDLCCQNKTCFDNLVCDFGGTCQPCGDAYHTCCSGGTCKDNAYKCDGWTCQPCGLESDYPCCDNAKCSFGMACYSDGLCHHCGDEYEDCCKGGQCNVGICMPDNTCRWQICHAEGSCTDCGMGGEPCCEGKEGGACTGSAYCNEDNICIYCGHRGKPVCQKGGCYAGDTACEEYGCYSWYVNIDGYCQDPFEVDAGADHQIICERVKPERYDHDRDWCYWYASYYKQDLSIYEKIEWGEMRTLCRKMANPGLFVEMPF